jgi:hypothetical protein
LASFHVRVVATTTRTWNDANGNYVPDCDLKSPIANGECGPFDNKNFGTPVVNTHYTSEVTRGWDVRPFIWQMSGSIQQELRPGIGLTVGYFRTSYGNLWVTDNLAVTPADYTSYCIKAPVDARLPSGGGYQVCGLYDINPAKFGQVSNQVTLASDFGTQSQIYNGIDAGINARFGHGGALSGGVSLGRTGFDTCTVPDVPAQFCKTTIGWAAQTQIKLSASYPLPWGLQASGVFQNLPGIAQSATYVATNSEIAPSLGRNLAACGTTSPCNATATVSLMDPNSQLEDRYTMLDVRLSKTIHVSRVRIQPIIDAYNLLNAVTPIGLVTRYGSFWLRPTEVLTGRFVKFGVQTDF